MSGRIYRHPLIGILSPHSVEEQMRNPSPCCYTGNGNGHNNETIIFPGKFNLPRSLLGNRSRNSIPHRSSIGKKDSSNSISPPTPLDSLLRPWFVVHSGNVILRHTHIPEDSPSQNLFGFLL
ncbi:hypothetical protein CDAR_386431 [Caerostris darwini]|uniref:Uncharacterized protein n=1 Tax=Caerostris darwini TaxID=1538125 RepID=A0AAV4QDP9_9ARAC|nr:hypothetical protein CDAR_386431 [Caerostris darwini]